MSDSSPDGKPATPAWQHAQEPPTGPDSTSSCAEHLSPPTPSPAPGPGHASDSPSEPPPRSLDTHEPPRDAAILLQQARKFLEDPTVRDAANHRKQAFLRSKGVTDDNIQLLLAEPIPHDVSTSTLGPTKLSVTEKPHPLPPTSSHGTVRELPPIVTYPEFLTRPTSLPPLINVSSVLHIIYSALGLGALTYGLANYILAPMAEQLSMARGEFATHTKCKIETINGRLEAIVSTVPELGNGTGQPPWDREKDALSDEKSDDDPAELYHRDIGTQTSPGFSRRASGHSYAYESSREGEPSQTSTEAQAAHLDRLTSELRNLASTVGPSSTRDDALQRQVTNLRNYLNDMVYSGPHYESDTYGPGYGSGTRLESEDAIQAFKAEIRGVKGVFLSSRNFPSALRRRE